MLKILQDYIDRLQALHADMKRTIDGLSPEALDWTPGPNMNSLAVLVTHASGAERYWMGDVAAGAKATTRDRDAEFRVRDLEAAALQDRLDEVWKVSRDVLDRLAVYDLEAVRTAPRDRREVTVAWALWHTLEHTAIHLGHMQLVRQLWEQRSAQN